MFEEVKKRYNDVFETNDRIDLDDDSLVYFIGAIQQYCVTESPRDAVADAFEALYHPP